MKKKLTFILLHLELIIVSLFVLVPMVWIILSAFQPGDGLASAGLLPKDVTLDNFRRLFRNSNYIVWFSNSLNIAVMNTLFSIILVMLTSWIMSRFDFKGKRASLMTILLLSMFPTFLSMAALYNLFLAIGLLGNPISLIIAYSVGAIPYNTWLVKGYLDGVPKSIDEAAYIDGCTKFQTFFKIILPLSKPIITYCAVSQFTLPWMDYILPTILLRGESNKTLAVGLFMMIDGKENTNFTMFAAGAILIAIPITLLFIIFQKTFQQGISAGADKG